MYLSEVILNPSNPKARRDLKSANELHRTLCSGFPNGERPRVLFSVNRNAPRVLMLSKEEPDFSKGCSEGRVLRARAKPFQPKVSEGQRLRFVLRANPTKKKDGKRLGLETPDQQTKWLLRKAEQHGFALESFSIVESGVQRTPRPNQSDMVHLYALYEGVLRVVEPESFRLALEQGIGSAKAFGFGMLMVRGG